VDQISNCNLTISKLDVQLTNFRRDGKATLGTRVDADIIDIPETTAVLDLVAPGDMDDLLQNQLVEAVRAVLVAVKSKPSSAAVIPKDAIDFCFFGDAAGEDYLHWLQLSGARVRDGYFYSRCASALRKVFKVPASHKGKARLPTGIARQFDYETESVIAFGPGCCDIPENEALDVVAGYTISDDFSAPELQPQTSQFLAGKASDGFASIGAVARNCRSRARYERDSDRNYRERKVAPRLDHKLRDLRLPKLISFVTGIMTTKPGDILFTGSPQGVILDYKKRCKLRP
jgi:hypothetical protein